jgi:F-type H+-transporting ATPase subunit b
VAVIQLDYTLLIQMANFLVLLWLLNKFLYKPILGILDERRRRMEDSERSVQELQERTSMQWAQYQAELQKAKSAANAEKEKLKAQGTEAERKLLEQARAEAARSVEEARKELEQELHRARQALGAQADSIGLEMAEKILGRGLR